MCGIFGYVGKQTDVATMVLGGLKTLEYRGYDSWGVAIGQSGHLPLHIEKYTGKIGDATIAPLQSTVGIGHTRWATHGGVTLANAHPHIYKSIAVVHNGIIENFQELRASLVESGHVFSTETDTEVLPHLIVHYMQQGETFKAAVSHCFADISGLNAFVAVQSDTSQMVAVKNGSPLVIGRSKSGYIVASDVSAIIEHTKDIYFVADYEMVLLDQTDAALFDARHGDVKKLTWQRVDWTYETAQKGNFPHFLIKEIHDQPEILRRIAHSYGAKIEDFAKQVKRARGVFFVGCGTASYAALTGTYLFSHIAHVHVNFAIGSEFRYWQDYVNSDTLVVPISQSGETIDVVSPVNQARARGARIAAVTNVIGSTIYRQADTTLLLGAGQERAVISTKAYLAMIAVLMYVAHELAGKPTEASSALQSAARAIERMLDKEYISTHIVPLAKHLVKAQHMYVLGRGLSYPAALEFALKMKETTYLHAEGFAGGELKHGVIALIEKGTPVVVLAPLDETYEEIISNAQEVRARGGYIIGISPQGSEVFDRYIPVEDVGIATMMLEVVVSQLVAYYLALEKGFEDPDKPRNLAKSVTVK